jgi:two-component system, NtrC family, response regulator
LARVLVIDDDDSFRQVMLYHLKEEQIEAVGAPDGAAGVEMFDPAEHEVVITDLKMPRLGGMDVLKAIKKRSPGTVVLVITAFGTIEKAVEAMKAGAFDFIPKPCTRDHFKLTVHKALEHYRLGRRVRELETAIRSGGRELIWTSPTMNKVIALIDKVAASDATVLITGESGTGKELLAARLHANSPRVGQPFVPVNCGAIPKDLIESELFGHVRGAFTGAEKTRKGKFEMADSGTIFLDEIAELSLDLQTKLLRVLSERTIDPVGSERSIDVDVRIVAATNRDLAAQIEQGAFREDLYYRLNVVGVEVPPLRKRPEDVSLLAGHFLKLFSPDRPMSFSDEAAKTLARYEWPGNVRELENVCRRVALLSEDEIVEPDALPPLKPGAKGEVTLDASSLVLPDGGLSLVDLEKNVIIAALKKTDFNQSAAARYLGVPRHVLLYRIDKYGINLAKDN